MRILLLFFGLALFGAVSRTARAADEAPTDAGRDNRPPKFLPGPAVTPPVSDESGISGRVLVVSRTTRITVSAEDPDGDALVYYVHGAPENAKFDARRGVLVWKPTPQQVGRHELGGLVHDGLGHRIQTRPYLGVHVWTDRRVWVDVAVGYRVVPAELREFGGPTASLGVVVNPW